MKFGKSASEAAQEPRAAGGDFIRYLKEGPNTFRILQEPEEWIYYWEHFNPGGYSYPCLIEDRDHCPGCNSQNEREKKASRKIAFNGLNSFNGVEYVNAFAIGPMVSEKLENRYKRFGTVTDRDYTITKYKTSNDRWDFDVEGATPTPVDLHKSEWKDIEELLARAYDNAWGSLSTPVVASPPEVAATVTATPEEPPFEQEKVFAEADLRAMSIEDLRGLIKTDMSMEPPESLDTSDAVVDWLMALQA